MHRRSTTWGVVVALLAAGATAVTSPPAAALPTTAVDAALSPAGGPPTGGGPLRLTLPGTAWTDVAVGDRHTVGLAGDGEVYAWGDNAVGQLGTGTTTPSAVPVHVDLPLPEGERVTAVEAGADFSVALTSAGTVWTWGGNWQGQLGHGTFGERVTEPAPVPDLTDVRYLAAGRAFVVAAGWDGRVVAWGANDAGQLGSGGRSDSAVPTEVPGYWGGLDALVAGDRHVLVLLSWSVVRGWGDGRHGQLGPDAGAVNRLPLDVFVGDGCCLGATFVGAAGDSSFVDTTSGLVAFGRNDAGQLGLGTVTASEPATPLVLPGGGVPHEIDGGSRHVVARSGGTVLTWGDGALGRLGQGAAAVRSPLPAVVATGAETVAAGGASTAVLGSGALRTWGDGRAGQLGDASTTGRAEPGPAAHPVDVTGVVVGAQRTEAPVRATRDEWVTTQPAITAGAHDVTVEVRDAAGTPGAPWVLPDAWTSTTTPPPTILTPDLPPGVAGAPYTATIEVRAPGPDVGVELRASGLPDGLRLDPVTGVLTADALPSAVGGTHTVRVTASSRQGSTERRFTLVAAVPAPALADTALPDAAAGRAYDAVLPLADGSPLRARVDVTAGALPDGTSLRWVTRGDLGTVLVLAGTPTTPGSSTFAVTTLGTEPAASARFTVDVGVPPRVVSPPPPSATVGVPYRHTFTTDGDDAQLFVAAGSLPPGLALDPTTGVLSGTPTTAGRSDVVVGARRGTVQEVTDVVVRVVGPGLSAPVTPAVGPVEGGTAVRVATPSPRFTQVVTRETHVAAAHGTLALTADGYVWGWGAGVVPLLGERGAEVDGLTPVRLGVPLEPGVKVSALVPGSLSLLVASDGTVREVVPDPAAPGGTRVDTVPLAPGPGVRVREVVAGDRHVLARTSDGAVWAWGANDRAQLGDGTTTPRPAPVRVAFPAGTSVVSVSASGPSSLAADATGAVWAWGADVRACESAWTCDTLAAVPTRVDLPAGVLAASVVTSTTVAGAVTRDGALWTWLSNHLYQQSGRGRDAVGRVDLGASAGVTVTDVALAREGGVAVLSDGSVRRWGRLACTRTLGFEACGRDDDGGTYEDVPVGVSGPVDDPAVAATTCRQCGLVLTASGAVWGWGANDAGQLGDGTRTRRPSPVTARAPFTVAGVTFGDAAARVTGAPANAVVAAVTPRLAPGPVDVVVTTRRPDGSPGPTVRYAGAYTAGTAPRITSDAPPAAARWRGYRHRFEASGSAPVRWSVTSGRLPVGLALDAATGVLVGVPLQHGSRTVEVTATNPWGSHAQEVTVTVG